MRQVMAQYKVKLDASTNQKTRQTTFFMKSEHKKELEKAKKSLLALLSPIVRIPVEVQLNRAHMNSFRLLSLFKLRHRPFLSSLVPKARR